jgi:hypothetical protein
MNYRTWQPIHELLAAVRKHRPLCEKIHISEAKRRGGDRQGWRCMTDREMSYKALDVFGKLLKAVEKTPFPNGRRDSKWLARADQVRQSSKDFWAQARRFYRTELEWLRDPKADQQQIMALLSLDSTPKHLANIQAKRDKILPPKLLFNYSNSPATH